MKMICGACGEVGLRPVCGRAMVEYKGSKGSIPQLSRCCDVCGATLYAESDVRENKRAWNRFKKQLDQVPLGFEIKQMREQATLTQRDAAELFGGGPVAFSKYESDDLIPDEAMINLLRLAIAHPDTVTRLAEIRAQANRRHSVRVSRVALAFELAESTEWNPSDIGAVKYFEAEDSALVASSFIKMEAQAQEVPGWVH